MERATISAIKNPVISIALIFDYPVDHNLATMHHFSGHYRERGNGFGALATGNGRIALPLARMFIVPGAKIVGKKLLIRAAPEFIDTSNEGENAEISPEKHSKKQNKKKQVGADRSKSCMSRKRKTPTTTTTTTTRKKKQKLSLQKKLFTKKSLQFFHQGKK